LLFWKTRLFEKEDCYILLYEVEKRYTIFAFPRRTEKPAKSDSVRRAFL